MLLSQAIGQAGIGIGDGDDWKSCNPEGFLGNSFGKPGASREGSLGSDQALTPHCCVEFSEAPSTHMELSLFICLVGE